MQPRERAPEVPQDDARPQRAVRARAPRGRDRRARGVVRAAPRDGVGEARDRRREVVAFVNEKRRVEERPQRLAAVGVRVDLKRRRAAQQLPQRGVEAGAERVEQQRVLEAALLVAREAALAAALPAGLRGLGGWGLGWGGGSG